jgi:hypothetical protein
MGDFTKTLKLNQKQYVINLPRYIKMDWDHLSAEIKNYINNRFVAYGIEGELAYNDPRLFPDSIKDLDPEDMINIIKEKDISHIMPKSIYPDLESDINNVVFEDSSINRARGAEIMPDKEIELSEFDYSMDINQFEESIFSSQTLPDELIGGVIGGALAVGMSSIDAYKKIQEGGLELYDAPRYVFVESGGKIIRCALIGVCASSGSTILVASSFAYSIYKAMPLIKNAYAGVVKLLSHPATSKIALNTGLFTISLIGSTGKTLNYIGNKTIDFATHDTTKNVAIESAKIAGNVVSKTAKGAWYIASHDTTKKYSCWGSQNFS